jgi:peptidoglycan/xylan/chitin deacetylase (PgdA/CDA1 family)
MTKLVFTFDDGIRTHYDLVIPLFREYGMTGTFFIPGDHVRRWWLKRMSKIKENDGQDMQEGPLTWEEIVEMDQEGFEIGNHTQNHPNMINLSEDECLREISLIEEQFAHKGIQQSSTFCYPGYLCNDRVAAVLRAMGHFKFARSGYLKENRHRGEPPGGNRPENRKKTYYYVPGETDPMFVNSTGIFNDWYSLDHFIEDVESTPEGGVAVFTAHGFARKLRWERFEKMVEYVAANGHETINFRDMPVKVQ